MKILKAIFKNTIAVLVAATVVLSSAATPTMAAAPVQEPTVSFTFDDGFLSTRTIAAPILEARGIDATIYVTSGFVDSGVTDDDNLPAMTWTQVQQLQNTYGWEIGGHTQTHLELPTLTQAQIKAQLDTSSAAFKAHNLNVENFASPFGAYDNIVLTEALKQYNSHRGFADIAYNSYPATKAVLVVQQVNSVTTLAQVKTYIDTAITNKQWLILVFHDVAAAKNPNYEYTTTTADLTAMAEYVKTKNVATKTVAQKLKQPGINMITNSTLDQAFTNGWTTDTTQVTNDTANNGAYGTSATSVKMTGATTAGHLFSNLVAAVPGANYLIDSFYNTIGLTSGEFGYYIDEYDTNGAWISGQWLGNVVNNTIGYFTKLITTTSAAVAQFRVQTYLTANAQGNVYVDNISLTNLDATASATATPSATPTASATPTPTPGTGTATNLIKNPKFDEGMSNWTTDNAAQVQVTTDASPSAKMTGGTTAAHLFQTGVAATSSASYTFNADANAAGLTAGEVGFYIDEYDTNGTWISGHWLGKVTNGVTATFQAVFKATTDLVKSFRVQTYIVANSVGSVFVDNYSLVDTNAPITPITTPTPSATPTGSPEASPSATPTASASATPTPTPTGTPEPTASPSATPTASPSATPTASASATPTPSGTPAPISGNLVPNFSFETLVSGFASLWEKDAGSFIINTNSKGNDGTNSLSILPNTVYSHAFSSKIAVDSTKIYTWKQHLVATGTTGEFGFYIDEYDTAGTWISGQWKGAITTAFNGDQQFTYVPTSATVKQVRLQYYTIPNSNFEVYLDSVTLTAN